MEIKSGYGLTTDAELKMLRVIKKIKENSAIKIKATFLGAHAIPKKYSDNKKEYLDFCVERIEKHTKTQDTTSNLEGFLK